ncbi:MAG: class I mannose-6-phosphate isomerase [Planctomycetia bacterium]|nr:class I mannose-6-phosphate isomerase [Planctomycetia bacterium]RLT13671.1 MAG: class I mannose-6-phosphate isomerase [Planctomycetota bacterium]
MHPLVFQPIYRRYLWGGRRFATAIGRELPAGADFAESWELVDRVADQSVVAIGPLAGATLGQLVREQGRAILGRHAPRPSFPLLFKFLDARRDLSVQVHPDDARAAKLGTPDLGKTEAWYVVDAAPGSRVYAGLRFDPEIPEDEKHRVFTEAVRAGRCEEMLHSFFAKPGDCIFIPAGTVHAIGSGLLVAEIQQCSDVTYRLHDWNRTGPDGKLRPLHIDAGLDAVTQTEAVSPAIATRTSDPVVSRLVSSPYFLFDEVEPVGRWGIGGDDSFHFLAVLAGEVRLESHWQLPPLTRGACVLLPAAIASQTLETTAAFGCQPKLLHITLP